jgi:phosphomannomutase
VRRKKIKTLSKGMAQKVQVLASIAHEPDFIIFDEPFSGLDPVNQRVLEDTIRAQAAAGRTILFSTHVMEVAERVCDRLAIIDERGRYIGEEYTLVLCAAARLAAAKRLGSEEPIAVTNLSTSRMLEDVAASIGGRVVRTAVGEANVVDGMEKVKAAIGGEGNGGVIDPRVVWGRDSHIGMALVLEHLATTGKGKTLSEVINAIPSYEMLKTKIPLDRATIQAATPMLRSAYASGAQVDDRDGIKFSWPDRWIHIRASGTEPLSRIIAEAPDTAAAKALVQDCCKRLRTKPL